MEVLKYFKYVNEIYGNSRKYSFNNIYRELLEQCFSNVSMPQNQLKGLFKRNRSGVEPKFSGDAFGMGATLSKALHWVPGIEDNMRGLWVRLQKSQ